MPSFKRVAFRLKSHGYLVRSVLLLGILLLLSTGAARSQQIDVEVVSAEATRNLNGDEVVAVALTTASRREFAAFSSAAAGRMIEIRSRNDVLATVRLQTSIVGGVIQFPVRSGVAVDLARKLSASSARLHIGTVEEKR